jgi:citrate synthase
MLRIVQAFWREEPLNPDELGLIDELFKAHQKSCFRNNVSSVIFANVLMATNDFGKSVAAAILTTGVVHAPIEKTIRFLVQEHPENDVRNLLLNNEKIPGWGGSFQKNEPDPIWYDVDRLISKLYPDLFVKLEAVTAALAQHGKLILPNPSAYTACVAIALAMPPVIAPYFFIASRLSSWAQIAGKLAGGGF